MKKLWLLSFLASCSFEDAQVKVIEGEKIEYQSLESRSFVSFIHDDGGGFPTVFCTGSVLSSTKILTAAHCFKPDSKVFPHVKIQSMNSHLFGYQINERSITYHQSWDQTLAQYGLNIPTVHSTMIGDLAVVHLETPLPENMVPVLLSEKKENVSLWAGGFGWTLEPNAEQRGKPTTDFHKASMIFVSSLDLQKEVKYKPALLNQGVCDADSGGPLYFIENDKIHLVGVLSRSQSGLCASKEALFSNIKEHQDWILEKMR